MAAVLEAVCLKGWYNMERVTKRELPESPWRVEPAAVERTEFGYSGTAIERLANWKRFWRSRGV